MRVMGPLELELKAAVSHHMDAELDSLQSSQGADLPVLPSLYNISASIQCAGISWDYLLSKLCAQ